MIAAQHETRKRYNLYLLGSVLFLWVIIALTQWVPQSHIAQHDRMGKPLIENFAQARKSLSAIELTTADTHYTLEKHAGGWRMPEAGGYPVRPDQIRALLDGLETLSFGEARTSDPKRHDLLGLRAPDAGGTGVVVSLRDAEGTDLTALIIGRRNDRLYVRYPGQAATFRAVGNLPPLYNQDAWLDFDIVKVHPSAIRAIRLRDAEQRGLYLTRAPGTDARAFMPAPPYASNRIISLLGVRTSALALSRLAPRGAKPKAELQTTPIGTHITETFDGLEIRVQAYREADGLWITLRAIEAGEGARRAEAINLKADGWAFRLSPFDFEDFVPSVSGLVAGPDEPVAQP